MHPPHFHKKWKLVVNNYFINAYEFSRFIYLYEIDACHIRIKYVHVLEFHKKIQFGTPTRVEDFHEEYFCPTLPLYASVYW